MSCKCHSLGNAIGCNCPFELNCSTNLVHYLVNHPVPYLLSIHEGNRLTPLYKSFGNGHSNLSEYQLVMLGHGEQCGSPGCAPLRCGTCCPIVPCDALPCRAMRCRSRPRCAPVCRDDDRRDGYMLTRSADAHADPAKPCFPGGPQKRRKY